MGVGRSDRRTVGLFVMLLCATGRAPAQVAPNRATLYLHPTDVNDARALWVNPAGLGRVTQASVHVDVTIGDPGPGGRLRQLTTGLSSRGFSFGYQRDLFDGGARGHTYRVAFAGGERRLAAGAAAALYRGGTSGTGWNVGVVYDVTSVLVIGGVIANIGHPVVRDSTQPVTYVPGATLRLLDARAALSADARITRGGVLGYALGARAGVRQGTAHPFRLLLRVDTDRSLRRAGFAVGLAIGAADVVGAVATTPGDVGRLDALSLYGVSSRRLTR